MLLLSILKADSSTDARLPLYNHFTNTYLLRIHSAAEGGMQDLMLSIYGVTVLIMSEPDGTLFSPAASIKLGK